MVEGWGSEQFLIYEAFYELEGVGHNPMDPKMCLITSSNNTYGLGWESEWFLRY